jgi:hypothetical protein
LQAPAAMARIANITRVFIEYYKKELVWCDCVFCIINQYFSQIIIFINDKNWIEEEGISKKNVGSKKVSKRSLLEQVAQEEHLLADNTDIVLQQGHLRAAS